MCAPSCNLHHWVKSSFSTGLRCGLPVTRYLQANIIHHLLGPRMIPNSKLIIISTSPIFPFNSLGVHVTTNAQAHIETHIYVVVIMVAWPNYYTSPNCHRRSFTREPKKFRNCIGMYLLDCIIIWVI